MINVAVVGVGNIGYHHARNYAEIPNACLVAIADADEEWGRTVAPAAPSLPLAGGKPVNQPIYAIVSTDIRRDLVVLLRHFPRLRIVHFYSKAPYGDLTPDEMDKSLIAYGNPVDLLRTEHILLELLEHGQ